MRFSCSLLYHADEFLTIAAIARMVQAMDEAGFDATFVTVIWRRASAGSRTAATLRSTASSRWRRVRASACRPTFWCWPIATRFVVAKSAASLDALSGGRSTMGRWTGDSDMTPDDIGDAAKAVDNHVELAEAGVTWTTMSVSSPGIEAFIDNVRRFGAESVAKVPRAD